VPRSTRAGSWTLQRGAAPVLKLFPLCGDLLTTMNIGNKVSAGSDYRATPEISQVILAPTAFRFDRGHVEDDCEG